MPKSPTEFKAALEKSRIIVEKVAEWLVSQGFEAKVKEPPPWRPTWEERMDYLDDGDIEIKKRVEVKQRELDFTSRETYPYDTIFVDEVYKVNKRDIKTLAGYVVVNRAGTHAALIPAETRNSWTIIRKYDSKDKDYRNYYECPKENAIFLELAMGGYFTAEDVGV